VIIPLFQTWFWLGVWLLYYLKFTNYAGIGLIETTWASLAFFLEIPTGAFSDLFGKKKTLMFAFMLASTGNLLMGFAQSTSYLVVSVFIMGIGGSLYSGTAEAVIYDSLKSINLENEYEKTLSVIKRNSLLFMASASFIGGYLYKLNNSLPFFATSFAYFIGMIMIIWLKEPEIDSEKFSLRNYVEQTKQGFHELFSKKIDKLFLIQILASFSLAVILIEVVDPALALDFGFSEGQLGIIYAIVPIISAIGAAYYPVLRKRFSQKALFWTTSSVMIVTTIISPQLGLITGGSFLVLRNFFYPFYELISSDTINQHIDSKYRATTISTFVTMLSIPYVASIYFIGRNIDEYGVDNIISKIAAIIFTILIVSIAIKLAKK
ncbi:MFS transporter, partial [Candidatus Dojkabacteria bacterium]|nr:MFS transporter [Candidatus Dojkabacteria bacterium]